MHGGVFIYQRPNVVDHLDCRSTDWYGWKIPRSPLVSIISPSHDFSQERQPSRRTPVCHFNPNAIISTRYTAHLLPFPFISFGRVYCFLVRFLKILRLQPRKSFSSPEVSSRIIAGVVIERPVLVCRFFFGGGGNRRKFPPIFYTKF